MKSEIAAVVLAAGLGKRMHSRLPKVLHPLCGRPLLTYVLNVLEELEITPDQRALIVGHGAEEVKAAFTGSGQFFLQEEQLGTGHAVLQAQAFLEASPARWVLVLCGDTPLLRAATLQTLLTRGQAEGVAAAVLTAHLADPRGYGRIVRDPAGLLAEIVEERDATPEIKAIQEINSGVYCFAKEALLGALPQLLPDNAQGEYYLTDVIKILRAQGRPVAAVPAAEATEILGVNTRAQLATVTALMRQRINTALMEAGVTMLDPATTYIDVSVTVGTETLIYPNTILEGETRVGAACSLGPNTRIRNSVIGDEAVIEASVILDSVIETGARVGPFAYLRPGTHVAAGAKVGDFVELKKATVGPGSKIPHLSYIGDTVIGAGVNIGAGTITCNYDGKKKHQTIIEDHAFIGSNTNLVAPIRIGAGALVGAGSTLTHDVPPEALALARARQVNLPGRANKKRQEHEG